MFTYVGLVWDYKNLNMDRDNPINKYGIDGYVTPISVGVNITIC